MFANTDKYYHRTLSPLLLDRTYHLQEYFPENTVKQHTPEWLCEPPLSFDDVLRPPSYLIASLHHALNDFSWDHDQQPPAYEQTIGASSSSGGEFTPRPPSPERRSIWEDWDSDGEADPESGSEGANDADDERDAQGSVDDAGLDNREDSEDVFSELDLEESDDSDCETLLDTPLPGLTPAFGIRNQRCEVEQQENSRPPYIPPPAYHLLHLHHLLENDSQSKVDPYSDLASCLSALDPQLLLTPFTAFGEACYHAAIRGDSSPPTLRPFSRAVSPQPTASTSSASSSSLVTPRHAEPHAFESQEKCPPLAERGDESDGEDEILRSPIQAFVSPPLVWDGRGEENRRNTNELVISDFARCLSPVSMSLLLSQDDPPGNENIYRKMRIAPHTASTDVASLFLHTPVPVRTQDSVQCFPTRPTPPRDRTVVGSVRGLLLRSLNFNRA
ncbi:hypothetical protein PHLCEN_2v12413 [Hermanssonia centrifuga]|uniref:Uncharacterized protein n=1 Tax=Hermanssonia centrifuga TaxID=98765 RepID=A0A2R6NH79_9APHY|nr:hypothetical protein PHLCEN_2v12413 [Hermanssonia centrifuga]